MKQSISFAGKLFGCFLPLFVGYGCQLLISFVGMFVYTILVTARGVAKGISEAELFVSIEAQLLNPDFLMIVTAIATASTLLLGAIWYKKHQPKEDVSLKEVSNGTLFLSLALMGVALQFLISICLNIIYPLLPQTLIEQYDALMETLLGGNVWLSLFVTVILAPLAEELLFRGVTMRKAEKIMPFIGANILQAILFGIYHGNLIQGMYAFAIGLILGFVAEYFHSIWASIVLHAFVNGSAELLSHLPESIVGTIYGVVGMAVVGVLFFMIAVKLFPKAKKQIIIK